MGMSLLCQAQSYIGYLKRECLLEDGNHNIIGKLKKGEGVFIFPNHHHDNTYYVNHILTNREGYIPKKHIHIVHEVKESGEAGFSVKESDQRNPIMKIRNGSKIPMRMSIDGTCHDILPKEEKNISVKRGVYRLIVTAPDVEPHYGRENLEEYKMYEWEFYIDK